MGTMKSTPKKVYIEMIQEERVPIKKRILDY
jgi:hypothetical protein